MGMSLAKATEAGFQPSGVSSCDSQVQYRIEVKFNAAQVVGHIIARSGQKRRELRRRSALRPPTSAEVGKPAAQDPVGAQKYDSRGDLRFRGSVGR